MKYSIIPSFILLGILAFTACKKQVDAPVYNDQPVIEAYLQAGNIPVVKISHQAASTDQVVYSVDNLDSLQVILKYKDNSYLLKGMGNGTYTDSALVVQEGEEYDIEFLYNKQKTSAATRIPNKPAGFTQSVAEISVRKIDSTTTFTPGSGGGFSMPDPIELSWVNDDHSYFVVVVKNITENPVLIRDTTNARFRVTTFRNEPSIINSLQIREQQFQYFGRHLILLYRLNPDYAKLYDDNSNSSQNLTNPSTNIVNGVGIFTGISADTLIVNVKEVN